MNDATPLARQNDIVVQKTNDETLIYDLKTNKAFCLNETSALVWELCDGKRTASKISDEMSVRFKTLVSDEFVWLALGQLNDEGLLGGKAESGQRFDFSRRDVIKSVGYASIVALPMISVILAPKAVNAQSVACGATSAACATGAQCCDNNCVTSTCCVPGVFSAGVPGFTVQCVADQPTCDGTATGRCCSGTATATADPICAAFPTLPLACICD